MKGRRFLAAFLTVLIVFVCVSIPAFAHTCKHVDVNIDNYQSNGVYQSTGVGVTKTITFYVCPNQIGVLGANKYGGYTDGVYKTFGPGWYTETLTDGFVNVVDKSDAWKEWTYRLKMARDHKWAANHLFTNALPK